MLDARGRNKLRKFKKHYPAEFKKLSVIISKSNKTNKFFFKKLGVQNILFYEHLLKLYAGKLPNWEGKS
jgi:DNA polymerase/3'-5' exonuclease PolX